MYKIDLECVKYDTFLHLYRVCTKLPAARFGLQAPKQLGRRDNLRDECGAFEAREFLRAEFIGAAARARVASASAPETGPRPYARPRP